MNDVRLFLVRVWQRLEAGRFRAAVQPFDGALPRVFSRPEQVAEYLQTGNEDEGGPKARAPAVPTRTAGDGSSEDASR